MSFIFKTTYIPIGELLVSSLQTWFDTHTIETIVVSTRKDDPQVPLVQCQIILKAGDALERANGAIREYEPVFAVVSGDEDECDRVSELLAEAVRLLPTFSPLSFSAVTGTAERMDSPNETFLNGLTARVVLKASTTESM